ncbi:MAG: cytochrome c3 family protein [bacterium]|nr:cytochrome c3 family protein [bacterium]
MADLLQRIVLIGALATPGAGAAPFSHELHLKLVKDCTGCHAAVTESDDVADNLLPGPEPCLRCHQEAVIKKPRVTNLSKFSHQQHLRMGNLAPIIAAAIDSKTYLSPPGEIRRHLDGANPCGACHRGMAESTTLTRAAHPQMADCLVCHSDIDPPFSCDTCHDQSANLIPASHTADFTDLHASGKMALDKASCAVCHGRHFTCRGCH